MNYEKAYKEVIESIKRIHNQADSYGKELMEKEFPELHELSETEMIEKLYRLLCAEVSIGVFEKYGLTDDAVFSWFEKQREHANFRNKIQVGDKVTRNEDGVLVNLSQLKRVAKPSEKQREQKPTDNYCQENCKGYRDTGGKCFADGECEAKKKAEQNYILSKEDEENRINAIKYLEIFDAQAIHGDVAVPCINWLKSLKPQKH